MADNWPGNNIPQANGAAADAPAEDDDFDDFGGFEAADPVPPNVAQAAEQQEAMSSPWAVYASGGGTFRQPDLLCAQNAFPQYLDPSGISGAPSSNAVPEQQGGDNSQFQANFNVNNHQQDPDAANQARIAENVLDGTLNATGRPPEVARSSSPAPLPDLGMGGSRLPLMRENSPDLPVDGAAAPVAAHREAVPPEPVPVENVPVEEPNVPDDLPQAVGGDTEESTVREKDENVKLKKDLEELAHQKQKLEDDLKNARQQLEEQQTKLTELQERHVRELEEVKKAGHDALTVVVDEYRESSRTAVLEQQQVSLQHLQEALKQQSEVYQQVMQEQARELKLQHEADLKQHEERTKQALEEAREEEQKKFDKFLAEQREKEAAEIQKAIEAERKDSKKLLEAAIAEEREKAEKKLEKEREKFGEVAEEVKASCSQDLKAVMEEERKKSQDMLASAVEEERERGAEAARESRTTAQQEIQSYLHEQRQNDSMLRQRHLTSLDLFLASARQQLQLLLETEKDLTTKSDSNKKDEAS